MKYNKKVYYIVSGALIAAIYTLLSFLFAPISFGPIQFRVSEVLCILPLFTPVAIPGLTIGCLLSNLIGVTMGQTAIWDLLFGTAATFLASIATYGIGKSRRRFLHYIFAPLPAVLFNGILIGWEITLFFSQSSLLWINVTMIMFGEFGVCYLLGIPLMILFYKNQFFHKLFSV